MSFNEKNMTVVVMPSEHAALDSFPLRYGIRFSDEEKLKLIYLIVKITKKPVIRGLRFLQILSVRMMRY
jgi:hypothetical protein